MVPIVGNAVASERAPIIEENTILATIFDKDLIDKNQTSLSSLLSLPSPLGTILSFDNDGDKKSEKGRQQVTGIVKKI